MSAPAPSDSNPLPDPPAKSSRRRRKGDSASDEAVMTLSKPIANWQAKLGWNCAMWGLFPALGLPLGLAGLILGTLGYRRVRRKPEDLGIRHAVGAVLLGAIETIVNLAGLGCIAKGVMELIG